MQATQDLPVQPLEDPLIPFGSQHVDFSSQDSVNSGTTLIKVPQDKYRKFQKEIYKIKEEMNERIKELRLEIESPLKKLDRLPR